MTAGRRRRRVRQAKEAVQHLDASGGTAIGSWLNAAVDACSRASRRRNATPSCSPTARTRSERNVGARPQAVRGRARACSSATAAASAPTGTSTSCAASRRRCSARSTSSPSPRRWPTTSGQMMRTSMGAWRRRRHAAGVGAAGRRGAVRPPGRADDRGPHRPGRGRPVRWSASTRPGRGATSPATTTWPCACPPKPLGAEQLVARVQLVVGRRGRRPGPGEGDVVRRHHPHHAHQPGGRALHRPDRAGVGDPGGARGQGRGRRRHRHAQARAGRRKLAAETGDDEATNRLKKVVDIEDAETGTVRLKAKASKLDEMALDTARPRPRGCVDDATAARRATSRRPPTSATSAATRSTPARRRSPGGPARVRVAPPAARHRPVVADAARPARRRRAALVCPNCATENPADALFCEACGYDFTTGQLPAPRRPRQRRRPARSGSPSCGSTRSGSRTRTRRVAAPTSGAPTVVPLRATTITDRPSVEEPAALPGPRLLGRRRGLAPARAADPRPRPLVRGGPRVHQRHLRRQRRASRCPTRRSTAAPTPRARRRRARLRRRLDPHHGPPRHRPSATSTPPAGTRSRGRAGETVADVRRIRPWCAPPGHRWTPLGP